MIAVSGKGITALLTKLSSASKLTADPITSSGIPVNTFPRK